MDIAVYSSRELDTVFRVLRTALRPGGALSPRERLFLDTYARITGYVLSAADPHPVSPQEVRIEGAHQRKRLIQLAAIAVLASALRACGRRCVGGATPRGYVVRGQAESAPSRW